MSYMFDPEVLHQICRKHMDLPLEEKMEAITHELSDLYPKRIRQRKRWTFNICGGSMGMLTILYASISEYLLFFGSPIGSEGFSGRYRWSHIYDIMLDGEMWCYSRGQLHRVVYEPGDMAYLEKGADKGYRMKDHAWMLEYSRGFIPAMFPAGALGSLLHAQDFRSARDQIWDYGRMCARELLRGKI